MAGVPSEAGPGAAAQGMVGRLNRVFYAIMDIAWRRAASAEREVHPDSAVGDKWGHAQKRAVCYQPK